MAHATHSVEIDQPIDAVYDFLYDGLNNPKWRPEVKTISRVSERAYAQTMSGPGGRDISGDIEFNVVERPTRLGFRVTSGPARPTGEFTLQDLGDGRTRLTFVLDFKPTGFMALLGGMVQKQMDAGVKNIERIAAAMRA